MEHTLGPLVQGPRTKILGIVLLLVCLTASSVLAQTGGAYRIGPDDVLVVSVLDQKDLDQVVFVRPDGKVSLALVGEVDAGGLTVADLAARLTKQYSQTVKAAQVTVGVREIKSRPVYFMGAVQRPATLQLTQELTVVQALSAAGLSPTADPESVFVIRGPEKIPVNVTGVTQRGDLSQNVKLQPGDTIVVPNAEYVYVHGEVKTPGQVKFTKNLTITRAIAAVGGFTPAASKSVILLRSDGGKPESRKVNVNDIMSDPSESADMLLKPNDVIEVRQRLF
jgi:polysaccharide export outer membrane protein